MEKMYDVAVVGGGISGFSAALTAKNLLLDCLWLGESGFGDKLANAERVTNYPAVLGNGTKFAELLERQKRAEGLVLTEARVDGIYDMGGSFTLTCGKTSYLSRTVILATGVESRASLRGEKEFLGRGVSYCAVCDGALYRGKRVACVLSSEKFLEDVGYLAKFASEVVCFCLYEGAPPKGEGVRVRKEIPRAVEGEKRVERILFDGGEEEVSGVFLLKNSAPPEALCGGLETENGHVKVDRAMRTNLAGLFACGDVTGRPYQYVKGAGEGCVAAHSAKAFLNFAK